jgi:hypothetical protein
MRPQSVRFLLWLLNYDNSDKTENYLRILHLSALPNDDHSGRLASYYGCHLHSLRVPKADAALVKAAINLKEIYLLYEEDITVPFLLSLPPTMEHIACAVLLDRTQAVENVLRVKEGGFGLHKLRAMSLYRLNATPWPAFEPLAAKARRLGFDLLRHEHRGLLVGGVSTLCFILLPNNSFVNILNNCRARTWLRPIVSPGLRQFDNSIVWHMQSTPSQVHIAATKLTRKCRV